MPDNKKINWDHYNAAIWRSNRKELKPISDVDLIDFNTLVGVEKQIESV